MINVSKLSRWRRPDLEAVIFAGRSGLDGNVAGDIVLGGRSVARSIRFSIEQHDAFPFVTLSAEGHQRCTDDEVRRFLKFTRMRALREVTSGASRCARSFHVAPRNPFHT